MYSLAYNSMTGQVNAIRRITDNVFIPMDLDNRDYKEFLEWNKIQVIPLDLNAISQEIIDTNNARAILIAARIQAIADNLPTWAKVETAIDAAFTDTKQNVVIKKLARIVYWLAKDSST